MRPTSMKPCIVYHIIMSLRKATACLNDFVVAASSMEEFFQQRVDPCLTFLKNRLERELPKKDSGENKEIKSGVLLGVLDTVDILKQILDDGSISEKIDNEPAPSIADILVCYCITNGGSDSDVVDKPPQASASASQSRSSSMASPRSNVADKPTQASASASQSRFNSVANPRLPTTIKLQRCKFSGCYEQFELTEEAEEHWREDHPKCPHCQSKKKGQEELDVHVNRWHPKCDKCLKRFRTRALLDLHSGDGMPCDVCSKHIEHCTQQGLDEHKQATHWQCNECSWRFFASESLRSAHIEEDHPTCNQCNGYFSTREEYVIHRQDPRKCTVCSGDLTWCNLTLLHKHYGEDHAQCGKCGWYLLDSEALSKHAVDPDVDCSVCQAHFPQKSMLDSHLKENHVKCTECDRYCFDQEEMSKHVADPVLRCSSCQTHYREEWILAQHLKDSFRCNLCTDDDIWICRSSAASLDDHRRDKHVECLKCFGGKYFRDEEAYRYHVSKVHSNRRSGTRYR